MSATERPSQLTACLLRPSILSHLLGTSAYGYDLRHRLVASGLDCDLGTVYRALNTMEEEGLLHSSWERSASGRSRRRYELSIAGTDMVDSYAAAVEQLVTVAQGFLDLRRRASGSEPETARDDEPPPAPTAQGTSARMAVLPGGCAPPVTDDVALSGSAARPVRAAAAVRPL